MENRKYVERAKDANGVKENLKMVYNIFGMKQPWTDENDEKKEN